MWAALARGRPQELQGTVDGAGVVSTAEAFHVLKGCLSCLGAEIPICLLWIARYRLTGLLLLLRPTVQTDMSAHKRPP